MITGEFSTDYVFLVLLYRGRRVSAEYRTHRVKDVTANGF
jgi:hypothetical protein